MNATSRTIGKESIELPAFARTALTVLESCGYEAWIVGGSVRDALLGRSGNDIDIACNARWTQTQSAFEAAGFSTHETGTEHGTLTVVVEGNAIEITTYRSDGRYSDGRHPSEVSFVNSIEEDLARRDFTINALAYHPDRGLLDLFKGLDDLRDGIIRTVGVPEERFGEDALRILRGCRLMSQLGFRIEDETLAAMKSSKCLLRRISQERITHEIEGLLMGDHAHDALMATIDVIAFVMPELVAMKGCEQRTPYHIYDVWEHTAWVVQHSPKTRLSRWAALLHDSGKPAASFIGPDGMGHFYGHAYASVELGRSLLERFLVAPALRDRILTLVRCHDDLIDPNPRAVKRALARLGGDVELFGALCDIKRADALSQAPQCAGRVELANELERILEAILAEDQVFSLKGLAINGRDILALGLEPGPAVGDVLKACLDAVIDERLENESDALLAFAKEHIAHTQ